MHRNMIPHIGPTSCSGILIGGNKTPLAVKWKPGWGILNKRDVKKR